MGRARPVVLAGLVLLGSLAAGPVAGQVDSLRVHADLGLGYDLTNHLWFEQSFDDTTFSERRLVSDPEGRVQAVGDARLGLHYNGGSRLALDERASVGDKLLRNTLRGDWRHDLSPTWRAVVTNEFDFRRDESFDQERRDLREAARVGFEHRSLDRAAVVRMHYRFDLADTRAEDGPVFYPDYRYHRLTVGFDRFAWTGPEWGLAYTGGYREFPDTSARNYVDHGAEGRLRVRSLGGTELELRGLLNRRSAEEDSAVGDRFLYGEAEIRFTQPLIEERWAIGAAGRFHGYGYDEPTPTYFHSAVPRAELFVRHERFPDRTVTIRLEAEFLRAPRGGGLGDPATDDDARNAVSEEYDQLAARFDIERLGREMWFFVTPSLGRRIYRLEARRDEDLLARSSYWFAQLSAFGEGRLGGPMRLRLSADLLHERHDVASDDLTSIFLATELRYAFLP